MHRIRSLNPSALFAMIAVLFVAGSAGAWWAYRTTNTLSSRVEKLETTLSSTTALLTATLEETKSSFSSALNEEKQNLQSQLGDISGTVSTLEKLSKTDPELLQKYSKVFFLNEHYAPERSAPVDPQYLYYEYRPEVVHASVWPHLKDLLEAAKRDNIELYVYSAYRSFNEQQALKGQYAVVYGAGTANQFSADQGYSEHQLGTTVDFITTGLGGKLPGFDHTEAYEWLLAHAQEYGFILSYPEKNGYYIFEPWHWRFVGEGLAEDLHRDGKYFYDLDQREIDKYLVSIFD